ncbi:MAG: hypothetical protein ACP5VQ_07480 [Phycisphaerae bacterium]
MRRKKARHYHTRFRAEERYGVHLSTADMDDICAAIQNQPNSKWKVLSAMRLSWSQTRITVQKGDDQLIVVYDKHHKILRTCLPGQLFTACKTAENMPPTEQ